MIIEFEDETNFRIKKQVMDGSNNGLGRVEWEKDVTGMEAVDEEIIKAIPASSTLRFMDRSGITEIYNRGDTKAMKYWDEFYAGPGIYKDGVLIWKPGQNYLRVDSCFPGSFYILVSEYFLTPWDKLPA